MSDPKNKYLSIGPKESTSCFGKNLDLTIGTLLSVNDDTWLFYRPDFCTYRALYLTRCISYNNNICKKIQSFFPYIAHYLFTSHKWHFWLQKYIITSLYYVCICKEKFAATYTIHDACTSVYHKVSLVHCSFVEILYTRSCTLLLPVDNWFNVNTSLPDGAQTSLHI